MKAGMLYVSVDKLRIVKCLHICYLDIFLIALGVPFDFALDFGVASSKRAVEGVIHFMSCRSLVE